MSKVPEIRFKEFSGDWGPVKLGSLLSLHCGFDIDSYLPRGNYPVYGSSGLLGYTNSCIYSKESILLGRKGTIGRPYYINNPFHVISSVYYSKFKTGDRAKFIYFSLCRLDFNNYNESSGLPSLRSTTLYKQKFLIPGREEQQKIADFLGAVDKQIELLQKEKELIESYKKSLLSYLLNDTVNIDTKSKYLLGEVSRVSSGDNVKEDREPLGKYPLYVRSNTIERINTYTMDTEAILTSGDGTKVGDIFHYVNGKFSYHIRVYCIHSFDTQRVHGKYLYEYFKKHFYSKVAHFCGKQTVTSLKKSSVEGMEVLLPNLITQKTISNLIDSVEEQANSIYLKVQLLEEYKKALLDRMFV